MWVVVLFVLLGGGDNLFGNKGNAATQADIQRGFDYSNEMSQMRGLTYGQANSTYALTNGINGLEKTVMQGNFGIMQQLGQNQQAAQMCCCETNRNIDAVRTEGYRNTCSVMDRQHRRQISFRNCVQLLFRLSSFLHLQVRLLLPLRLSNKLVVS